MQRRTWFCVGTLFVAALGGCSGTEPAPRSEVDKSNAGGGGAGGAAGSLSLGIDMGGGGAGGGGAGGVAGSLGGSAVGGVTAVAGSSGDGGSGGSKPTGTCKRAPTSDANCADFDATASQAYACDDRASYGALNGLHANMCLNGSGLVPGAAVQACCPP